MGPTYVCRAGSPFPYNMGPIYVRRAGSPFPYDIWVLHTYAELVPHSHTTYGFYIRTQSWFPIPIRHMGPTYVHRAGFPFPYDMGPTYVCRAGSPFPYDMGPIYILSWFIRRVGPELIPHSHTTCGSYIHRAVSPFPISHTSSTIQHVEVCGTGPT